MFSTMLINQSHQPFDPKSRLSNSRGAKSDVASKHEKASLKKMGQRNGLGSKHLSVING